MRILQRPSFFAIYVLLYGHLLAICVGQTLIDDLKKAGIDLVDPKDPDYKNASNAFNQRFEFKPAVVTYPTTVGQVSTIVKTAVQYKTHVTARCGGHSYIANGLGGHDGYVVIDLNHNLTGISYDNKTQRATVQGGNRLGNVALGLSAPQHDIGHGTCPYVGIGGHASYGGYGFTSRMWGLALDSVVSMEVVLADGSIVTASSDNTATSDLFWGMRGAGPSFGITTSFTLQTKPVPPSVTVFVYNWTMNTAEASAAFNAYQTFSLGNVPLEFGSELVLRKGTAQGTVNFTLTGGWYGAADKFDSTINPLLKNIPQKPWGQYTKAGSYIDSVGFFGGLPNGRINTTGIPDVPVNFYVKSLFVPEKQPMTGAAQDKFITYLATEGLTMDLDWFVGVEHWGGIGSAINTGHNNDTSFATRDSLFCFQFYGFTDDPRTPFPNSGLTLVDGMVDSIVNTMGTSWKYSAYANYIDNRLQNWQKLYFGANYKYLQNLKQRVDGNNVFQFPMGIELPRHDKVDTSSQTVLVASRNV